jgi:hypothetical protein
MARLALAGILLLLVGGPALSQGAAVVLVPGAGGASPRDFLIRNRPTFSAAGLQVAVALSAGEAASAVSSFKARGLRVTLVGMSAGTPTVAEALAMGAPADRLVLAAGMLMTGRAGRSVASALGSPSRLPPTLIVHHRQDECRLTPPEGAQAFANWSRGRAQVRWIDGPSGPGAPCGPMAAHGFYGLDAQAAGAVAAFAAR